MGRIAAGVGLCYAVYALFMFANQRAIIYPGRRAGPPVPAVAAPGAGLQRVWLPADRGRVEAWYAAPPPGPPAAALLFAHGNAEELAPWPSVLEPARELGMGALLVEYPGYGRSDGEPSAASIGAAMRSGYDWLAGRSQVDPTRIVGFGRSLGGAAVCTLVGQRPLVALVLQSAFTSLVPFAHGAGLPGFLLFDQLDNVRALQRFDGAVMVVHGERDQIIPPWHGEALARTAGVPLLRYACGHNDCPPDVARFGRDLGAFLRDNGVLR